MTNKFTPKQGQYLAFIYYYTKLNGRPPAFMDFENYFETSSPSVNSMIKRLEELGLIGKEKGMARSIRLTIDKEEIPDLE